MKKVGLIVNPIAGMGGKVGLKGTDGYSYFDLLEKFDAKEVSNKKCEETLDELLELKDRIEILTYGKNMGEDILKKFPFKYTVVGSSEKETSNYMDTINAAKLIFKENVDILIFVGGDGTARNIYEAVGINQVCIGIPSGVKMHSAVHGITPRRAGQLVKEFLNSPNGRTIEAEVMDIDEEIYKEGRVFSKLYGYLKIPLNKRYVQNKKTGTIESERYVQDAIALYLIEHMSNEFQYLIGPGSTIAQVMKRLNLENSILGVDLVYNNSLIGKDLNEKEILKELDKRKTKLIITPTGGQGFLLGRGNQQISEKVISKLRKENIIIAATKNKLISIGQMPLLVDLGDEINNYLSGYYKIVSGYDETIIKKISF